MPGSVINKDSVPSTTMTPSKIGNKLITFTQKHIQRWIQNPVLSFTRKSHFTFLGLKLFICKMRYLKTDSKIWMQESTWGISQSPDSYTLLGHMNHNLGDSKIL